MPSRDPLTPAPPRPRPAPTPPQRERRGRGLRNTGPRCLPLFSALSLSGLTPLPPCRTGGKLFHRLGHNRRPARGRFTVPRGQRRTASAGRWYQVTPATGHTTFIRRRWVVSHRVAIHPPSTHTCLASPTHIRPPAAPPAGLQVTALSSPGHAAPVTR